MLFVVFPFSILLLFLLIRLNRSRRPPLHEDLLVISQLIFKYDRDSLVR